MALLSAKERSVLPRSAFALPEERRYPIPDEEHAKDALARVAANGNGREKRRVAAAVHKAFPELDTPA